MMKKNIFNILVMLAVMAGMALNVWAVDQGSYTVSNNTHYVNPDTETADDGGDVSTGEGMCRNTVYPQSCYEFKDGKHYVTLRIKMISFIENVRINVQTEKGNKDSYQAVEYEVSGENTEENTRDFRFEIPASDILIKPTFFVGPMNRDVTFFVSMDMETAKKDEGEFSSFNKAESVEEPVEEASEESSEESLEESADSEISIVEENSTIEKNEKDIESTIVVDDKKDNSTDDVPEPSDQSQPSQDINPEDNTIPVEQNTQGDKGDSDSSSSLDHVEEDSAATLTPTNPGEDSEVLTSEVETKCENVENKEPTSNNNNSMESNKEKDGEVAGISEFNEEGVKKLQEKENDRNQSRLPIVGTVVIIGIGSLLVYSKKRS
ncbi:MAG: hypothetical protein N4A68_19995 [Maledivibacter sp.]|jgi:hypothetical protein|nr:hypothetical protein [Maledivibacter sp.]